MFRITVVAALAAAPVFAQTQDQDQINNFCRRFAHRTTVIDNSFYIDGGYINYGGAITNSTSNDTNTQLLYADTTYVNGENFPVQHNNLTKPDYVPSVAGGALWPDEVNKVFYAFGGEYDWDSQPPSSFDLYYFDTVYRTWNTADRTNEVAADISPPAFGASAVDPNKGVAYYYGGWKSNATDLGHQGFPEMQSSVISYDMTEPDSPWRKMKFYDDTPRAEGALFYIPASDAGMLVYFGGVQQVGSRNYTGVPMNTIYLYDIGAARWFTQQTSGTTPPARRRFCGGVSWPEDRSSYNIYFFGGAVPYDEAGTGYGDVWILSLPSFTWTLYWPDAPDNQHHSLSCDIINQGQMIVMGGYWPNSSISRCDVPAIWGMHNLNLGSDNVDGKSWYQYLPNLTDYTVPPNLTAVVGGTNTGNATVVTPAAGFSDSDLGVYLGRKAQTGTRAATRDLPTASSTTTATPKSFGSNTGAIAGGTVGSVVGIALLAAILFICLRRRKRAKTSASTPSAPDYPPPANMAETTSPHPQPYQDALNKQDITSQTSPSLGWQHTPAGSPQQQQTNWQPVAMSHQPQQQHFLEDLPRQQPQQFYPPPPQPQQYYPPPPDPQQYVPPSPTYEMPNVRSPSGVGEIKNPGGSPRAWRTPSAGAGGRIDEEW